MLMLKGKPGLPVPPEAEFVIPGGTGKAFEVSRGQLLTIVDIAGGQVAALFALTAADEREFMSPHHTRVFAGTFTPHLGLRITTNRRRPIFVLVRDSVGRHDMLMPACDRYRYEQEGRPGHRSCLQNLREALEGFGLRVPRLPDPINLFMNVVVDGDGKLTAGTPLSKPNDYVTLRVLKDAVCVVSACPLDSPPWRNGPASDLKIRVHNDPFPGM